IPMLAVLLVAMPRVFPSDDWSHARAKMVSDLCSEGGKHLVILRHGRHFNPHQEWVYNGADLETAPVVWARELDSRAAGRLLDHCRDRTAWLLNAYRPTAGEDEEYIPPLVSYTRAPEWMEGEARRVFAGGTVIGMAVGDMNRDGKIDLALLVQGRAQVE